MRFLYRFGVCRVGRGGCGGGGGDLRLGRGGGDRGPSLLGGISSAAMDIMGIAAKLRTTAHAANFFI